jgi:uncharacterized protein
MSAAPQRAHFADELRGFALLGIVLVNTPFLAISTTGYTAASLAAWPDRVAAFLVVAFAQAKFYLIFSFLFGYSLSFLLSRNDPAQRTRYKRRLLGLALLGSLHAVTAFVGDILLLYALLGTMMLVLVRWSDRRLFAFAGAALGVWLMLLALLVLLESYLPSDSAVSTLGQHLDAKLATGSFTETVLARFGFWPEAFVFIGTLNGLAVLAMFAVGLIAGRHGVLSDPDRHSALWRIGIRFGFGIGLPLGLLSAYLLIAPGTGTAAGGTIELAGLVLNFASAPFLSYGYIAALARLRQRSPDGLRVFRSAGRMSLTGYLGESILLSLIFCGYGGALFGEVGVAVAMLIGIGVWAALDGFSHLWLKRFDQGPFEMVLRRITS